jgi:hypothetical protein
MISATHTVLFAGAMVLLTCPLQARPLDLESCARLKAQRDILEAAGVRSLMAGQPPARPQRSLDDNAQRIVRLILLDGQLRFRCNMEMPIATLKPELLVEVPDTIDGEPVKVAPPKRPASRAAGKAAAPAVAAGTVVTGTPAPQRPKTAGTGGANASALQAAPGEAVAVKPRPKPKPRSEDAFRAPAAKSDAPQE